MLVHTARRAGGNLIAAAACRRVASQLPTASLAAPASVHVRSFWWLFKRNPSPPTTPDEALEALRDGNKRFTDNNAHKDHPTRSKQHVKDLATGQKPFAGFLSCADSRVPVEIIFDQGFGDVFVTRVAGNIVTNEIIGSLEFGTAVLGAKVLMVLGHSKCGAVSATIAGNEVPGIISSLYYGIRPAVARCGEPGHTHDGTCGYLDRAIEENVKYQVELLRASPVLADLQKENKLKIVGGVYDLETGKVKEVQV